MLFQVLKISLIGHRKRILASLGDRLHEDPPQKPPRSITLRVSAAPQPRGSLPHTPEVFCAIRCLQLWIRDRSVSAQPS